MILRESLYKGPQCIVPHTAEVPAVPTGCYQFLSNFYQKRTTFDKNYQKDNLWGSFLLVHTRAILHRP